MPLNPPPFDAFVARNWSPMPKLIKAAGIEQN